MHYEFLPPYSPDLNPIELAFSSIKARIWWNGEEFRSAMSDPDDVEVYVLLHKAVWSITPEDALGWFHHSGYL
jgi:DDE superfamily endonuclease